MPSTTASWARPITSYEGIPQIFKEFIPQMEPFPYIIYSPPDAWGNRKTNGKLTCMYQDRIVVLEVMGKRSRSYAIGLRTLIILNKEQCCSTLG